MTDINPVHAKTTVNAYLKTLAKPATGAAQATPVRRLTADRVELSELARYRALVASLPAIRTDLVNSVRQQIQAGTYETDEKLTQAIEALAADL